jgi:peptidoglycan hydrolase CwlO-like protein
MNQEEHIKELEKKLADSEKRREQSQSQLSDCQAELNNLANKLNLLQNKIDDHKDYFQLLSKIFTAVRALENISRQEVNGSN